MAIRIEQRYRGLRSRHKLKMAVSGCTRECAEAQGKDVGVIATEKGWNLYVCGNGGMKPRHADLLAKALNDKELIRCIDRFLMLYIRTGDRLQRTSVWLENLEGGIDYVRKVVCEDALGIGAELEAEMQKLADSYECEWKNAIGDPEVLKRFRHFVNSDAPDSNVVFVADRGQIRPARVEAGFGWVEPRREVATTCCYCGIGCGVLASVCGDAIVSVRGDPKHPANFGRLCTKGLSLHKADPSFRGLFPEINDERKSWDETLAYLAGRFADTIARHGPDSVAFYVSGQFLTEDYYAFNKLAKGLIGTNNIDTNSRLCMASAVASFQQTLGADAPPACYEDIDHAGCVFIAGSNTACAHPVA